MDKMSIKTAIEIRERWRKTKSGEDAGSTPLERTIAETVVVNTARAWLALEAYAKENECLLMLAEMQKLLNPAPKTDIERVRQWAEGSPQLHNGGVWISKPRLEAFLDQLEKEHASEG